LQCKCRNNCGVKCHNNWHRKIDLICDVETILMRVNRFEMCWKNLLWICDTKSI
jgi:hypothetical protein